MKDHKETRVEETRTNLGTDSDLQMLDLDGHFKRGCRRPDGEWQDAGSGRGDNYDVPVDELFNQ